MRSVVAAALLVLSGRTVGAQAPARIALDSAATNVIISVRASRSDEGLRRAAALVGGARQLPEIDAARRAVDRRTGKRVLLSGLGTLGGALVGGLVGYELLPRRDCGDDPGLCEMALGAALGSVFGAALGAAAPSGSSECSFGRRFAPALLGAVVGGALGFAVGDDRKALVLVTLPLGATAGAVVGGSRC